MMNIYFQELRFYRRSMIIWIIVLSLGVFGYLSLFTTFSNDITASKKLLEGMPAALRAALSIRLETFFTIFGFFGYLLTYIWLLGSIQAMNLGVNVLSKETSNKTADFLLSKPVNRNGVLTAKLMAGFTGIVITNLFFVPAAYFSALTFSKEAFDAKKLLLVACTLFLVQLFFLAVGFLISTVVPRIRSVLSYSLPIVFGLFIFGLLDSVIGADNVRFITPFKYFDPHYIISNASYDVKYLLVELGVVVFCIVTGYIIFNRKDIQAVA